jgi:hypothetical protein
MRAAVQLIMDPQASIEGSTAAMTEVNLKAFNIEAFTLLGIVLLVTVLRSCVRIRTVGCRNLWADDYLVILAAVSEEYLMWVHDTNSIRASTL